MKLKLAILLLFIILGSIMIDMMIEIEARLQGQKVPKHLFIEMMKYRIGEI